MNRETITHRWHLVFRKAIHVWQRKEFVQIIGDAEVDESYFGAMRVRGYQGKLKRDLDPHVEESE
jgi:hypothetical protein